MNTTSSPSRQRQGTGVEQTIGELLSKSWLRWTNCLFDVVVVGVIRRGGRSSSRRISRVVEVRHLPIGILRRHPNTSPSMARAELMSRRLLHRMRAGL